MAAKHGWAAAGVGLSLCVTGPAAASDHSWHTVADVGVAGLVVTAFGASTLEKDWQGDKELALSLGATAAEAYALKHVFPEQRPNGRDNRSFPSGHTSIAFAAAGYLEDRYGWQAGLPAAAVATLVGVARVRSHDHHWYDAVAGAALGGATALIITKPIGPNVQITPWSDGHGGGLSLAARF